MRAARKCALLIGLALSLSSVAGGPWVVDLARAQTASDQTACLSFHEVHPRITSSEAAQGQVPDGYKIYPSAVIEEEKLLLREEPVVRGSEVADVQPSIDQFTNQPVISFR